jgi:hypothetical protein
MAYWRIRPEQIRFQTNEHWARECLTVRAVTPLTKYLRGGTSGASSNTTCHMPKGSSWIGASVAKWMRTRLARVITQRVVIIAYRRFGTIWPIFNWPFKIGQTARKHRQGITTTPCEITQKRAILESRWNPNSNTPETDRPPPDRPTTCYRPAVFFRKIRLTVFLLP